MPTKNPDTSIATIEEEESSFYDYNTGVNNPTTCYYYDGQMSICESYSGYQGENFAMDQTRNTLGARGIDMIEAERVFGPSGDTVMAMGKRQSYPIYDGHGNMLATLVKNGSSYSLQNEKRYDPWGGFTVGSGPGSGLANPSEAYCANLGHKSDAESDFIYMRARYYEPGSGRFISQDTRLQGSNWFQYCGNDPINRIDESGNNWRWATAGMLASLAMLDLMIVFALMATLPPCPTTSTILTAMLTAAVTMLVFAFAMTDTGMGATAGLADAGVGVLLAIGGAVTGYCQSMAIGGQALMKLNAAVGGLMMTYSIILLCMIFSDLGKPNEGGFQKGWD